LFDKRKSLCFSEAAVLKNVILGTKIGFEDSIPPKAGMHPLNPLIIFWFLCARTGGFCKTMDV
jgi:hypothetical protein